MATTPGTGGLVETFVVNELVRQVALTRAEMGITLSHYRAHNGAEIDVVAEAADGRVVAFEVKASSAVRARDFGHLSAMRDRVDALDDLDFVAGVVLYAGGEVRSFGDRLTALPLAALWEPAPRP